MKYKVMIVEDQTMPRELFELRIQASERFEVALSIDNAALADVYCLRFPVDLILMDVVTHGGESGLDAAERIKRTFPQMKIIIVTSMPECSYLSRAREIGVESFWYKEEQRESLLDVMTRTMAGESVYPDATPELQLGLASTCRIAAAWKAAFYPLHPSVHGPIHPASLDLPCPGQWEETRYSKHCGGLPEAAARTVLCALPGRWDIPSRWAEAVRCHPSAR